MMRFSGLTANERWLLGKTKYLTHLRRSSMPLLYGDYRQLYVDDNVLVFSRTYLGQEVVVALNKGAQPVSLDVKGRNIDIPAYGYTIKM